jgi:hypothetical protein
MCTTTGHKPVGRPVDEDCSGAVPLAACHISVGEGLAASISLRPGSARLGGTGIGVAAAPPSEISVIPRDIVAEELGHCCTPSGNMAIDLSREDRGNRREATGVN